MMKYLTFEIYKLQQIIISGNENKRSAFLF